MKKTALASALALAIGGAATVAEANTTGLTGIWTGTYSFSMTSANGGPVGSPTPAQAWTWDFTSGSESVTINNTTTFYASVWTAYDVSFTDNGTSYGGGGAQNMTFNWSVNPNIPVTEDWDVEATGNAVSDTAVVTVNAATILPSSSAFPGFHPAFAGSLTKVSGVPVPAAVWLMGSGLLGLVGVARRRRNS